MVGGNGAQTGSATLYSESRKTQMLGQDKFGRRKHAINAKVVRREIPSGGTTFQSPRHQGGPLSRQKENQRSDEKETTRQKGLVERWGADLKARSKLGSPHR